MSHMEDTNPGKGTPGTAKLNQTYDLDPLLSAALRPELTPPAELNERILSGNAAPDETRQRQGIKKWYVLPRVAVAAAAFVLIGSVGVYAATQLLKTPEVTEHTVSVGNTEYVDDDAIMATEEPATVDIISTEEGDGTTKWLTKKVETVNGYTNTWLTYATYADAAKEAGMELWIGEDYQVSSPATYVETEGKGYHNREVSAEYSVNEGTFRLAQSVALEGVAVDAAYSIRLGHPTNERTFTAGSGLSFKLVDDAAGEGQPLTTYVLIAYDKYTGYLAFTDLSEEEIHRVLEAVTIN